MQKSPSSPLHDILVPTVKEDTADLPCESLEDTASQPAIITEDLAAHAVKVAPSLMVNTQVDDSPRPSLSVQGSAQHHEQDKVSDCVDSSTGCT